MSERDVLIGPGADGDFMASFENVKSEAAVDPTSQEILAPSNCNGVSVDPDSHVFSDGIANNINAAVLTSTPVLHRSVCFDSVVGEDTAPLVQADSLMRNPSEGTDRDVDAQSEESSQYDDDVSQEGDCHREVNVMQHVLSLDHSRESLMVPGMLKVPIVGYETMESRSKFTIYKIHVMMGEEDPGWFVFRRYSDFVHLNEQLRDMFPNMRLALPPKRWFRSNFDPDFLQDRKVGLQEFLENVTGHRDICSSQSVRDFFCFDDPPSIHDNLDESRAQCECLEEMTHLLRKELGEKEIEMDLLKEEIDLYKNQVRLLTDRLSEYNKSACLQEKASLDGRSFSSMSTPSLRMRSLNMRSSVTDMEKSESDLKNFTSDFSRPTAGANSSESDSNTPCSALSKLQSELKTSTPVRGNNESEDSSSVTDLPSGSVAGQRSAASNLNDFRTSDNDLSSFDQSGLNKSLENPVSTRETAARDGGQEESSALCDGDAGSEAVQLGATKDEVDDGGDKE